MKLLTKVQQPIIIEIEAFSQSNGLIRNIKRSTLLFKLDTKEACDYISLIPDVIMKIMDPREAVF